MINQTNQKSSNFCFSFLLGMSITTLGLYFFGTQKGRKTLQKIISFSENVEKNLNLLLDQVDNKPLKKSLRQESCYQKNLNNVLGKIKKINTKEKNKT